MFIVGNLLMAVAQIVNIILTVAYWLILVRALVSWFSPDPFNPLVQFLYQTTEPLLQLIRRFLPVTAIDFSPLIAFLLIYFLKSFLVQTLFDLAVKLR